jgi:hypothetical protein
MNLKQMLRDDFGKNLPIDGGFGASIDEPIRITTADPFQAALAQLEVARCIYGINGWYWRTLGRAETESHQARVEKFSSEVKYIEGDEIITEKRNFYFDITSVDLPSDQQLPEVRIPLPGIESLSLPWQMGWFHFDNLTNNEVEHPGLGVSVAYSAPEAKMTIYAYNKGMGEKIKNDPDGTAKPEFDQAIADFVSVNPTATSIQEHEEGGVRLRIYECEGALSVVLLAPFQDLFFKLRLTLSAVREPFMVDCAWFTVSYFSAMVRKSYGD